MCFTMDRYKEFTLPRGILRGLLGTLLVGLILVMAGVANAEWIEVKNAGFEAPAIVADGGTSPILTDWFLSTGTPTAQGGGLNPSTSQFSGEAPGGQNVAWSSNRQIFQLVDAVLMPNSTYTLEVEVGDRLGTPYAGYLVQLLAFDLLTTQEVLAEDQDTVVPVDGAFATSTVVFTTGASHSRLGNQLMISLYASSGALLIPSQASFDNVSLEVQAIPEPTSIMGLLSMLCVGLVGYACRGRRTR